MHAMPSRMETNAPAVRGRFRHRVKGGRAWRPHGVSSAQRNVHRCGPFHCVRHGTCRVHLQSIAGTYTGRYAQALSVPHAELDERGEVVPHGRPMPSTPPLALSYAVKLSGSNRARFWYLLLPRGASTLTRRATRACPAPALGGSPHSGLRNVCTYHSGKVTPILHCHCACMRRGVSFVDKMTCQAATGAANGPCRTYMDVFNLEQLGWLSHDKQGS